MTSPSEPPFGSRPASFDDWLQAFKEQASFFTGLKLAGARALASPLLRGITDRVIASFLKDRSDDVAIEPAPALAVSR